MTDLERDMEESIKHLRDEVAELKGAISDGPNWVTVGERMPEPGIPVIAFGKYDNGNSRRLRAQWCPRWTIESSEDDSESAEYHEERDNYYLNEGWYETNEFEETHWKVEFPITHWMPLPEGPK